MPNRDLFSTFFSSRSVTSVEPAIKQIIESMNKLIKSNNNLLARVRELEKKVELLETQAKESRPSRKLTIEGIRNEEEKK